MCVWLCVCVFVGSASGRLSVASALGCSSPRAHPTQHSAPQHTSHTHQAALDKVLGSQELMGAPLLLVANKQDAEGAVGLAEVADAFGLGKLDSRPVIVQPASAHSGRGLSDGLQWLVEAVKRSNRRHLVTTRRSP